MASDLPANHTVAKWLLSFGFATAPPPGSLREVRCPDELKATFSFHATNEQSWRRGLEDPRQPVALVSGVGTMARAATLFPVDLDFLASLTRP